MYARARLLATLLVCLVVSSAAPGSLPLATTHPVFRRFGRTRASARSMHISSMRGGVDAVPVREVNAVEGQHKVGSQKPVQSEPTLEQAREIWMRAVDVSPQDASLLFEYALFLQEDANDWLGAEGMYKKVIRLLPDNAAALSNYGTILSDHRGDLASAESAFQLAILINPNDGTALANYAALVLEKRHEPRRAQELYLYALQADPSNIATLYNYAAMLVEHVHDLSGASRLLQIALHIDPASRDCRERLAAVERQRARRSGEKAAAAELLRWPAGGDGGTAEAPRMQCVRDFTEAGVERERRLFRAAIVLEPAKALALHDYASLLVREGNLEEATAIYKVSLQQDPLCVPSLLGLGISLRLASASGSGGAGGASGMGGGGQGGGEPETESRTRRLDAIRTDVLTIFARAHQIQPTHVGVRIELGDLLVEAGCEAEGGKLLHMAFRDEGCSPRLCVALSRFYAESRLGWGGPGTRLSYVMAHQVFQAASRAIPSHPTPLVALARLQEHCHEHPSYDPLVQGAAELETLRALHVNVSELENMDQDDLWKRILADVGAVGPAGMSGEGVEGGGPGNDEIMRPDWKAEAAVYYRRAIALEGGGFPAGAGAVHGRWAGPGEEPPLMGDEGLLCAQMTGVRDRGAAFAKASLADLLLQKSRGADGMEEEAVMLLAQALQADPDNWKAKCILARRRLAQNRQSEARQLLRDASAAAPWHAEPALLLARVELASESSGWGRRTWARERRAGLAADSAGVAKGTGAGGEARERVLGLLQNVLNVDPRQAGCLKLYGEILWAEREFQGAHAMLTAALKADPGDHESILKVAAWRKGQVPLKYSARDIEILLIQATILSQFQCADALYALATWVSSYCDAGLSERQLARHLVRRAAQVSPAHRRSLVAFCFLEGECTSDGRQISEEGGTEEPDGTSADGHRKTEPVGLHGVSEAQIAIENRLSAVRVWKSAAALAPDDYRVLIGLAGALSNVVLEVHGDLAPPRACGLGEGAPREQMAAKDWEAICEESLGHVGGSNMSANKSAGGEREGHEGQDEEGVGEAAWKERADERLAWVEDALSGEAVPLPFVPGANATEVFEEDGLKESRNDDVQNQSVRAAAADGEIGFGEEGAQEVVAMAMEAWRTWQRAARVLPSEPDAYVGFARLQEDVYGDGVAAGRAYLRALMIAPSDPKALYAFGGYAYDWLFEDDVAITNLLAAIRRGGKRHPNTPGALAKLASILVAPGPLYNTDVAESMASYAHRLAPRNEAIAQLFAEIQTLPGTWARELAPMFEKSMMSGDERTDREEDRDDVSRGGSYDGAGSSAEEESMWAKKGMRGSNQALAGNDEETGKGGMDEDCVVYEDGEKMLLRRPATVSSARDDRAQEHAVMMAARQCQEAFEDYVRDEPESPHSTFNLSPPPWDPFLLYNKCWPCDEVGEAGDESSGATRAQAASAGGPVSLPSASAGRHASSTACASSPAHLLDAAETGLAPALNSFAADSEGASVGAREEEEGEKAGEDAHGEGEEMGGGWQYWHLFDEGMIARDRAATDAWQQKVIDKYNNDYPTSPREELAWARDPSIKVFRKFRGKGRTSTKYLDCQFRLVVEEVDVERWRLLGREVRIIDHEVSERRRQERKESGQDIIQTAQGFSLTEDQFYLREEWPPPDAELQKEYDEMPVIDDIYQELAAQGRGTVEELRKEVIARSPKSLRDAEERAREQLSKVLERWHPACVREAVFPPELDNITTPPPCPPGYFQMGPRSVQGTFEGVDPDYKAMLEWKEKDEKEGHLWYKVYEELKEEVLNKGKASGS